MNNNTEVVISPCVAMCKLDEQQVCVGCKRTLDEISHWRHMSEKQKQQVLQRLQSMAG